MQDVRALEEQVVVLVRDDLHRLAPGRPQLAHRHGVRSRPLQELHRPEEAELPGFGLQLVDQISVRFPVRAGHTNLIFEFTPVMVVLENELSET